MVADRQDRVGARTERRAEDRIEKRAAAADRIGDWAAAADRIGDLAAAAARRKKLVGLGPPGGALAGGRRPRCQTGRK